MRIIRYPCKIVNVEEQIGWLLMTGNIMRPRIGPTFEAHPVEAYPVRANLYPLTLDPMPMELYIVREVVNNRGRQRTCFDAVPGATIIDPSIRNISTALQSRILEALQHAGFAVREKFALVADTTTNYAPDKKRFRIYPAYELRIMYFGSSYWLCLDHKLIVRASVSLASIEQLDTMFSLDPQQRVVFRSRDGWDEGRWIRTDTDGCYLALATGGEAKIAKQDIIPSLTKVQIAHVAPLLGMKAQELERTIKQLSFLTISNAPQARLEACTQFVKQIAQKVFPLCNQRTTISINPIPAALRPPHFVLATRNMEEVAVAFDHVDGSKHAQNILTGLTSFGAYGKATSQLRLVLIATQARIALMERLVGRLNRGAYRYQGAQKTFGSEFIIQERLICANEREYEEQIRQFVRSDIRKDTDVALVYLPKVGNTSSPKHPYFRVKGLLVREGLASQMVDETTAQNLDWRDLNLALNVYAKAGNIPWVLDDVIPGVDLFIGLSSSQPLHGSHRDRMMGYANIFDAYGRWQFYQGDSMAFPFNERLHHYGELIKNSIAAYRAENRENLQSVHIHLTKAFSAVERSVLANAVRLVAPNASVIFVWINPHHPLRLYDLSEASGQISRATYLYRSPSRFYLATTGNNIFSQRSMGTPVPLELNIWADPVDALPSHQDLSRQILSLTRLNWASSHNFCQEPITTKFAGDIASLMTIFMEDPNFTVNPSLRGVPWFL